MSFFKNVDLNLASILQVFRLDPIVKKEAVDSEAAESAVTGELSEKERQIKGREKLNSKFGTKSAINRVKAMKLQYSFALAFVFQSHYV